MNPLPLIFLLALAFTCPAYAGTQADPAPLPMKIHGISYDDKNPAQSIIAVDNQVLKKGDSYKGYKITEVYADHVVLADKDGTNYQLSPGDGSNPSPASEKKSWNPLENGALKPPQFQGNVQNWFSNQAQAAKSAAAKASQGLSNANPMKETQGKLTGQLDKIKADRDRRDAELAKLTS